jgi:hypothetical protein
MNRLRSKIARRSARIGLLIGLAVAPLLLLLGWWQYLFYFLCFPLVMMLCAVQEKFIQTEQVNWLMDFYFGLMFIQCLLYGWFIGKWRARKKSRRLAFCLVFFHLIPAVLMVAWWLRLLG